MLLQGDALTMEWPPLTGFDFAWHDIWTEHTPEPVLHCRLFSRYLEKCEFQGSLGIAAGDQTEAAPFTLVFRVAVFFFRFVTVTADFGPSGDRGRSTSAGRPRQMCPQADTPQVLRFGAFMPPILSSRRPTRYSAERENPLF
jgi:hypothetical protein